MFTTMKRIVLVFCICLISILATGCKSSEDYRKEGKYQEAYDNCKDSKEKDDIIKENELAVILINCDKLMHEIKENVEITNIYKVGDFSKGLKRRNIKYIFDVQKKKVLGNGYYQSHYYTFTDNGSLNLDIYINDITEIIDLIDEQLFSSVQQAVLKMDMIFGTSNYVNYANTRINLSEKDKEEIETNELYLRELRSFSDDLLFNLYGDLLDKEVIENLNHLVVSGKINNVQLIKK